MDFKGRLKVAGAGGAGIATDLRLDDIYLELWSEGEELGVWRLDVVEVTRSSGNRFALDLDGEAMEFEANDPLGFAYEGLTFINEVAGKLRKKRRGLRKGEESKPLRGARVPAVERPAAPAPSRNRAPEPATQPIGARLEQARAGGRYEPLPPAEPEQPKTAPLSEPARSGIGAFLSPVQDTRAPVQPPPPPMPSPDLPHHPEAPVDRAPAPAPAPAPEPVPVEPVAAPMVIIEEVGAFSWAADVIVEPLTPEPAPVPAPEPVAVVPEPERVVVVPEPEPVMVVPEPEPPKLEPEPAAFAPEPEPEPVAIVPDPAPEPVAVVPEPEPVVFTPEPVAMVPDPAPGPVAVVPEPEPLMLEREPVVFAPEPEREPVVFAPEPEREVFASEPEPEPVVVVPEPEPLMLEPEPVVFAPEPVVLAHEPEPEPVAFAPEPGPEPVAFTSEPAVFAPESESLEEAHDPVFGSSEMPVFDREPIQKGRLRRGSRASKKASADGSLHSSEQSPVGFAESPTELDLTPVFDVDGMPEVATEFRERGRHATTGKGRASRRRKPDDHNHEYDIARTVGGLTRRICVHCGHVSFDSEDVYQGWG